MKKFLLLLVYLLTFNLPVFSQTKEGSQKRHPMSKHFGWDDFGMYRISMGYSQVPIRNLSPAGENTNSLHKLNYFKNGYTDLSLLGVIDNERQRVISFGMIHNGPSNSNSIHIGYGQVGLCDFFKRIFNLKICGVWATGFSLRSRIEEHKENFDVGIRASYTGSNRKIAIKSHLELYNNGPINYSFIVYRFLEPGILIESGITNHLPIVGIGYAMKKIRASTHLGYIHRNNSYFSGITFSTVF